MRFANAILEYIKSANVDYLFGIPAGTISPLVDALNDVDITPIVFKNEGGAAYSAARYASVNGKMALLMGAGGVGVNNMLNGIADAYRTKAPVLVITGYVHRWQIGKGAIQELNTEDILKPVTKYSKTILKEEDVMTELVYAIKLANTVPKGPVHLSIPIDIQLNQFKGELPVYEPVIPTEKEYTPIPKEAYEIIDNAKKGVILVGKGARGFSDSIMNLSMHLQWPIVTTPEGKGVIPAEFNFNLGNYGFASTEAANAYVTNPNTDCLLVIGSSLGENATSNFSQALVEGKKVIHIDFDARELGKVYTTDVAICMDLKYALPHLIKNTKAVGDIGFVKPVINQPIPKTNTGLSLKEFMEKLPEYMPKDTYYMSDMGEFMNFLFKYLHIPAEGDFETNLNYAAMGCAIGGAVGVHVANTGKTVAVIAGDGDFFMNGMEILTAQEFHYPIVYFIVNNAMLGFVDHGHQFLFNRVVTEFKQKRISIANMLAPCGIRTMEINDINQMSGITELLKDLDGPAVIELITDGSEASPNGDRLKALSKLN